MTVSQPNTRAPNLDGYRSAPQEDQIPAGVDDNPNPDASAQTTPIPEYGGPDNPAAEPPLRADPRMDIARRARARREANDARNPHLPIDDASIPEGIPVEGENAAAAEEPAPAQQTQPQTFEQDKFTLRVNQNEFRASRDEVLRYAELSPEDAQGLPDYAIVRLAQKNLAAQDFLEQAKEAKRSARLAARSDEPEDHTGDQRQTAERNSSLPPGIPPEMVTDEELEAIQLGDKDEAKKALAGVVARLASQTVGQVQTQAVVQNVQAEIQREIQNFEQQYPDIVNDAKLANVHRSMLVHEAIEDLKQIPGVTQEHVLRAYNEPTYAMALYQAARADGYNVRSPADIFSQTGAAIRQQFVGSTPRQHDPSSAYDARREAKRGLVQQPARSDSTLQNPPTAQATGRRNPSDVIRQMGRRVDGFRAPNG